MAKIDETAEELTQTVREVNQAVTKSISEAQQRSMKYVQSVFKSGIEVLKENTQDSRKLTQSLMEQSQEPQHAFQTMMESAVAVQERNIKFAQGVVEKRIEVLKSQGENSRTLMQTLLELYKKQQEAFQAFAQESMKGYFGSFSAPFSFYQKVVESTEEAALHGVHTAQKTTRKGVEANHKATHVEEKATAAVTK